MPLLHAIVHARRTKDEKYVMHQVSTAARAYSSCLKPMLGAGFTGEEADS